MQSQNILILNWRDPQSPLEGGAERFTQRYAEYWCLQGHSVVWLTNSFPNCQPREVINKVEYIRVGPALTGRFIHYLLFYPLFFIQTLVRAMQLIHNRKIDVVIDEIHGLPFFSPLFSSKRNVLLVCEVAGSIWDKMFSFPINRIGSYLEKMVYHLYKNTEVWAISENTKQNIQAITPRNDIKVIDLGVEIEPEIMRKLQNKKKTPYPSAVFLARLVKMKGAETALLACRDIVSVLPDFHLYVLGTGDGEYVQHLHVLVAEYGIGHAVTFVGHIDGYKKYEYLAQAHFLLHPSYKEGFGLTVIEAGMMGTPAIVRSGSSLDALVQDGVNGFRFGHDKEVAELFIKHYKGKKYTSLLEMSKKSASHYRWQDVLHRSDAITKLG